MTFKRVANFYEDYLALFQNAATSSKLHFLYRIGGGLEPLVWVFSISGMNALFN